MTIGEIVEALKCGKALAGIGKELSVGKEKLSKALKEAGYLFNRRTGWTFTGSGQEPVNREYTEFIGESRSVKIKSYERFNKRTNKVHSNKQKNQPKNE